MKKLGDTYNFVIARVSITNMISVQAEARHLAWEYFELEIDADGGVQSRRVKDWDGSYYISLVAGTPTQILGDVADKIATDSNQYQRPVKQCMMYPYTATVCSLIANPIETVKA